MSSRFWDNTADEKAPPKGGAFSLLYRLFEMLFPFIFLHGTACMKQRSSDSLGAGCFPLATLPHPLPCRERKRFLVFARNDECGEAVFSYRHTERSRGIFFVCRVPSSVWSGLHETPFFRGAGSRVFPACRYPHILCLPTNEKDFSLSLEMTNACEAAFSYRYPERSRGIFFVCRVPFPVWSGLHETPFLGAQGAEGFPLPAPLTSFLGRERKRFLAFARNDECGEAAFSYRKPSVWGVCEAAFSLLPMEGGAPKGRRLALAAG